MPKPQRTVLVVDETDARENDYRQKLQQDPTYLYQVLIERYTPQTVILCRSQSIDVVLLHVQHLQFLEQLTQANCDPCPTIIVIGHNDAERAVQALKLGATDYLTQARMTGDNLCLAVRKALARRDRAHLSAQDTAGSSSPVFNPTQANFYRLAVEAGQVGTWDLELDTQICVISAQMAELMDYPPHQTNISSQQWWDSVVPEDRSTLASAITALIEQNIPFDLEFRITLTDGRERWLYSRGDVVRDETGHAVRILGTSVDINQKKQLQAQNQSIEASLQESEELNQGILDSSSDCIKVLTLEGQILYMNQGGLTTIEADDPQAVLNTNWISCWQGKAREQAQLAIANAIEGKKRRFQGYFPTLTGKPKWWDVIVTPLRDRAGQVVKLVVISRDITAQKQTETTLRHSEKRYRSLIEATSQIIWDAPNAQREFVTEQPGWSTFTGQSFEELKGWGWLNAVHPDDRAMTQQAWLRAIANHSLCEVEHRLRRYDGVYRYMSVRAVPVLAEDGTTQEWIGVHTDITERQQAEAALRESEERFRTLADNISQFTWMADPTGWIFWYNRRWFEYTGTTLEEMEGWGWQQVHHPDHIERVIQKFSACIQKGKAWEDTFPLRSKEGEYRWFLSRALPIRDEAGNILRWFGTNTDITKRKETEDKLEQLVEREQAAKEEAERANRLKDEFLAILSHELRSPLNPILGWARLLQTRNFNEERTAQALATIERNAKLQTQLIDDLLDVAKILRGKLSLNMGEVNLTFVVEAAIETVKAAAVAKSISLEAELAKIGKVQGDTVRLQQVVWNLLSNAIKFTPQGGQLKVCLEQVDHQAQITVRDTGKGIHPDFLPHIFESFRQQDASITRQFGGLGLGLAIVRYVVESHDGIITVDSPGEEQGTTFTVKFPVIKAEPENDPTEALPDSNLDLSGIRVLAVDDHLDTRDLLTVLLTQYGAEVETAASANEALEILESFQPDVLVSDIGMPDVTGYTLIQKIRALPPEEGRQVGAIALTAYAREEDKQRALDSGYQVHIAKPLDPEALVQTVLKLVR